MLRKKYHVVRKKYHVVRKLFYVASIFGGAARRRNRPPWEVSSTAGEVSSTAGYFSSTASLSMRLPNTRFGGLSQTSLPDFRQAAKKGSNFHDLGIARLPACLHFCHRKLTPNLGTPVIATSAMEVMRSGEARARYNKSSHLIFYLS